MLDSSGRRKRRRLSRDQVALGAGLIALALMAVILTMAAHRSGSGGVAATLPATPQPAPTLAEPPAMASWPRWGVTHTQYSADNEADGEAGYGGEPITISESERVLLSRVPMIQNQHIMGWGAGNPEPMPGRYDFTDLDRRIRMMADTRALPVITLCCAPDWMKGGPEGRTDWSKLEVAPQRDHFDDFAALAATVARRYPTVKHYMVWNEFKGFWNDSHDGWDAEAYTDLYNRVYDALKKVNPEIQVGGPYIPIDSDVEPRRPSALKGPWGVIDQGCLDAFDYWNKNKKGADFVVVDGASATGDRGVYPDEFTALDKFGAVTRWLREHSGNLPVWWSEWYIAPENIDWDERHRTAVQAVAMMEFVTSGADTALYWNPQRKSGDDCAGCLWRPGTGEELPMAGLISGFTRWFPKGVESVTPAVSDQRVRALATADQMIIVNTTAGPLKVTVDARPFDLDAYEVKWSDR